MEETKGIKWRKGRRERFNDYELEKTRRIKKDRKKNKWRKV